jgi:hypothetical protein
LYIYNFILFFYAYMYLLVRKKGFFGFRKVDK